MLPNSPNCAASPSEKQLQAQPTITIQVHDAIAEATGHRQQGLREPKTLQHLKCTLGRRLFIPKILNAPHLRRNPQDNHRSIRRTNAHDLANLRRCRTPCVRVPHNHQDPKTIAIINPTIGYPTVIQPTFGRFQNFEAQLEAPSHPS